jgi:hypothetical protein
MGSLGMEMDNIISLCSYQPPEGKNRPEIKLVANTDGKGCDPSLLGLPEQKPIRMAQEMILMPPLG